MDSPPDPPAGNLEDATLVRRCLDGDDHAWTAFVDRFRPTIWRVAYRFTALADDADELTQDVFIRLLTVLPTYRPSGTLDGWVRRVANNFAIDAWRKRRRMPKLVPDEEAPDLPTPVELRADEAFERREEAVRIRRLLDRIPGELAEPVVLRDLLDLDYGEIAGKLGIPLGTVKSRIHRGRLALCREYRAGREAEGGAG